MPLGHSFAGPLQLSPREVDPREREARRELTGLTRPTSAPQFQEAGARFEPRAEIGGPGVAGVVGYLLRPRLPGVDHGVVAVGDEPCARVTHSTSTSRRRDAASARSSASRFVSAVAIT